MWQAGARDELEHAVMKVPMQRRIWGLIAALSILLASTVHAPLRAQESTGAYKVTEQDIDDLKAVFATVRSKDRVDARVRTPGTVASLKVTEGDQVKAGQVLAIVVDPKIALKLQALDAQIVAVKSRLDTAKSDFERAEQLKDRGVVSQSRYDQLKTAFDVATNELKALQADRAVNERQGEEGQVLAPADGRVLKVPVTEGSVVLMGESVATLAANSYLLRLMLPERHARFMHNGAIVKVGARGLVPAESELRDGHIIQVYPELENGHVVADATTSELGDYFVGERTLVWISAGKRKTIIVPTRFIFRRYGLDYVRIKQDSGTIDVVVQLGRRVLSDAVPAENGTLSTVEVLTGLRMGDELVQP
jgi:RND family efflux transporter MFP subunit